MADFDFNESRRARVDVARGAVADDIPLLDYTNDDTTGGGAETSFIDPPEDVWEAQNEMPSWAASSVPSGAQHTNALVDRWQIERGEVQQNLEFASSTKGDLWLKWGKKWLLITNKNKPGEFLAPSTIKRYRVDVAKALGVYKSTNLSPQDDAVLKKTDQQVGEAASDIETAPLEDLGQTIIKVEAAVQTAGNIFAVPERPGVPPMTQRDLRASGCGGGCTRPPLAPPLFTLDTAFLAKERCVAIGEVVGPNKRSSLKQCCEEGSSGQFRTRKIHRIPRRDFPNLYPRTVCWILDSHARFSPACGGLPVDSGWRCCGAARVLRLDKDQAEARRSQYPTFPGPSKTVFRSHIAVERRFNRHVISDEEKSRRYF
ncbi:hypothetical protein RRG08_030498 [Elysia crispata]|uniref:Uncharacterized protein n=1 Tax=Elysia crispata TaxID=231223 RepID=A0AAE0Y9L0_9GAST|nr:hypothetical protein RRG08_030498 [Elysia crispata]